MVKKIGFIVTALLCILVLTGCGCEHVWLEATCEAPKTCELCGETEGEPGEHLWQEPICGNRKSCSICGMMVGEKLEHKWLDANCETPQTCEYCGLTTGDPDWRHTLKSNDVITECEICGAVVEVFYDAKGDARYYTEFEVAADGSYINPITKSGKLGTQWYKNGNLEYCVSGTNIKTFCVDSKIYYQGSLLYDVSANTREDLIEIAKQYVTFAYAHYYEDKMQDMVQLSGSRFGNGNLGQVYAVVDAYGERYVFIHEGQENNSPEATLLVKYDWRS